MECVFDIKIFWGGIEVEVWEDMDDGVYEVDGVLILEGLVKFVEVMFEVLVEEFCEGFCVSEILDLFWVVIFVNIVILLLE